MSELLASRLAGRLALLAAFDPKRFANDADAQRLEHWYSIDATGVQPGARMLSDGARIEALAHLLRPARHREALVKAREDVEAHFEVPLQNVLDQYVFGQSTELDQRTEEELVASLQVVDWVNRAFSRAGVAGAPGPTERERIEGRLRLLAVRRPIDALLQDPFIGRKRELNRLREFGASTDPSPPALLVYGIGGMGKSTLVAKFVQEVIDAEPGEGDRRRAWAYLDFDRATLNPGQRDAGLFSEEDGRETVGGLEGLEIPSDLAGEPMRSQPELVLDDLVRQIGAQHPDLRPQLEQAQNFAQQSNADAGLESIVYTSGYDEALARVGHVLAQELRGGELVVVLDTFEEVERQGPEAGEALQRMFNGLSSLVPTLRLVVSGRAPAQAFWTSRDRTLEVGELDESDAIDLLSKFAAVDGQLDEDAARTVFELVGRSPLSLRLAGRVLADQGVTAIEDAARRGETLDEIRKEYVRGFLYHRILDHVIPDEHQLEDSLKLVAKAGLVLRRLDTDILDQVVFKAVGLEAKPGLAARHLAALEHEVAIIQHGDSAGAGRGPTAAGADRFALRPDLREPALLALELEDGSLVRKVHELAKSYFAPNEPDHVYHRLALGAPVGELAELLTPEVRSSLQPNLRDLPAETADALRTGSGDGRDTDEAVDRLRDQLAWERQAHSKAEDALRRGAASEALLLLTGRSPWLDTTELHRLHSRICQAQRDHAGAIAAARLDLEASEQARHPTRFAAAVARLAQLLEWRKDQEALVVLRDGEAASLLAGHWALRLELVLNRIAAGERLELADADSIWTLGLDARSHLGRLAKPARATPALQRLLAAAFGRDEPVYLRDAVAGIGLDSHAREARLRALSDALFAWDRELGRGRVGSALRFPGALGADPRAAWFSYVASLGEEAAEVFTHEFWSLGAPPSVLEALRQLFLWAHYEVPREFEHADPRSSTPRVLNSGSLRLDADETNELHSYLVAGYSDSSALLLLARKAGLRVGEIDASGSVSRTARSILSRAASSGRLRELINLMLADPTREGLSAGLRKLVGEERLAAPTNRGDRGERVRRLKRLLEDLAPKDGLEGLRPAVSVSDGGLESLEADTGSLGDANAGLEKLLLGRDDQLNAEEADGLEAIIYPSVRPVAFVRGGRFDDFGHPWMHLNAPDVRERIEPLMASVGRIEQPDFSIPYAGTGFVVGPGLVMTNRHVARLFCDGVGERQLTFTPGSAMVDFTHEVDSPEQEDGAALDVIRVVMVHPYWDMALLEVDGLSKERRPLELDVRPPEELEMKEVATVGYPARDPRSDPVTQDRIFEGIYNVKRMLPGRIRQRQKIRSFEHQVLALTHDCATLAATSGAPVIDLETGRVVALHFSSRYLEANYAVPMWELARDERVVRAGLNFAGEVEPRSDLRRVWADADALEGSSPALPSGPTAGQGTSLTFTIPLTVTVTVGPVQTGALVAVTGVSVTTGAASAGGEPGVRNG